LYALGDPAFRADTMIFYDLCHRPLSAWTIMTRWMELMGRSAQFPFALASAKGLINIFDLPVTDFTVRLSSALWGTATVIAVFFAGRLLAGRWFGVLAALLMAVNPFHIQLSREAYYYAPLLLGTTLMAGSVIWALNNRGERGRFPWYYFVITALGFFLSTYSHLSGWWIACLAAPITLVVAMMRTIRVKSCVYELMVLLVIYVIIGLPLLFVEWGAPYFIADYQHPENYERTRQIMGTVFTPVWTMAGELSVRMTWGDSVMCVVFLAVVVLLAMVAVARSAARSDRNLLILLLMLVGAFALYVIGQRLTFNPFGARHVAFLQPLYLLLLAMGIREAYILGRKFGPQGSKIGAAASGAMVVLVLLFSIPPAIACTQLTGKPTPFKDVVRWCDTQLPPHTLVLVERWFDPWNELRVHNSTNIFFTFTVPAEPQDVFERYNWPATAKAFFEKFPDAAYLEYCNSGRARMGVVTNWHFARQAAFTNMAGIKLAQMGVAYRDEFYNPYTNQLMTTIFYNTREDVIRRAREQGQAALVLYGPEWGYVKLWQQLKDFRDWRILEKQAALDVYNLTASTNCVTLKMRGMTLNGSKRIFIQGGGQYRDFRHLQLEEWALKNITLRPGLNKIVFTDSLWSVANVPLLVDQVEVSPLP